ncbi:MAG: hypothetical protein KIT83_11480 [Bryobacterales bacterium]|nr:hypothetical protein [Bryobacterales bacterium]
MSRPLQDLYHRWTREHLDSRNILALFLPATAPGQTLSVVVGQIHNTFPWNPQMDGAIDEMEFGFDLRAIQSNGLGSSGCVGASSRPILVQGDTVYRASSSILQRQPRGDGSWTGTPFSFVF